MSTVLDRVRALAGRRNTIIVAALLVLAVIYPTIVDSLQSIPLIGDFIPKTDSMVVMIVFTTMAVGLNVVVGYAGLLDLGYVAFYAVGAYTAGWFASQQFDQVSISFGAVGSTGSTPGIHVSMWLVLILAGVLTTLAGIAIGLPTLRLRGDYLAIVTLGFGEIIPQFVRNGDQFFGFDLTHGTFGISPIDSLGFGSLGDAIGLPDSFRQSSERSQWFFWTARRDPAHHRLLQHPPARLPARARVDRDPRGRDGGRRHGHPVDADEDLGVRDRGLLRRGRGRVLRELQVRGVPCRLLLQHLGVPALHGHPGRDGQRLGRDSRRHDPRLSQRRGPRHDRVEDPAVGRSEAGRVRPDEVPVRDLRDHHRADDAVPARPGSSPSAGTRSRWPRASTTRPSTTCSTRAADRREREQ